MRPLQRLTHAILDRPRTTLLIVAAILALAFTRAIGVDVDFRASAFFPVGTPEREAYEHHVDRFGPEQEPLVVVISADGAPVLEGARTTVVREIADVARGITGVVHGSEPLVQLISDDGLRAALVLPLEVDTENVRRIAEVVERVEAALLPYQGLESLEFAIAGVPAVRAAFVRITVADQALLVPLSIVLMSLTLWVTFRTLLGVVVPILSAFAPLVILIAVMTATGESIGLLNQVYFTLIPAIAVADAIHYVHRFQEEMRREGGDDGGPRRPRAAIARTVEGVGRACFLTSFTSLVGFWSLLLVDTEILRRFGFFAGIGIAIAYVAMLVSIPAMLLCWPGRATASTEVGVSAERAFAGLVDWSVRHRGPVVGATLIAGLVLAVQAAAVRPGGSLSRTLPPADPVAKATTELGEHLGGSLRVSVELHSRHGTLERPETRAEIARLAAELLTLADVRSVTPDLRAADHGRLQVGVDDRGVHGFSRLVEDVRETAERRLPAETTITVTGKPVLAYASIGRVLDELGDSTWPAAIAIASTFLLVFRRVGFTLAAIVANGLPLLCGIAAVGLVGPELEIGPAVVLPVGLGLAVDDTLHFLSRYEEERRAGRAVTEALRRTGRGAGAAMTVTSIALAFGFGLLLLASVPSVVVIGWLGVVLIGSALLCDLVVLPALLSYCERDALGHGSS